MAWSVTGRGKGGRRSLGIFSVLVVMGSLLALVSASLVYVAVYRAAQATLDRGVRERASDLARQEARRVAQALVAGDTYALARVAEEIVASRPELWLGAGVWDSAGEARARSTGFPAAAEQRVRELLSADAAGPWAAASAAEWALVLEPVRVRAERVGSFVLVYDPGVVGAQLSQLRSAAARGGALVLLATVALAIPLTAWIARPIRRLEAVAERAAAGDLAVRADEHAWGEAGALGRGVNRLLERTAALLAEVAEAREGAHRARLSASLSQLGAGLAHEIRNPLTTVKLLLDHLWRAAAGTTDVRVPSRDLGMLESQVAKIDAVLEEFVAFARPAGLRPAALELPGFAQECVRSLEVVAREAGIRLILEPGPPVVLWADRGKLDQALRNLVKNAVQHAPPDTAVVVGWDLGALDALLWVEDQGAGVPPELRDRIFEPFFAQRSGGLGLGLAIVRSVAEQHGGTTMVTAGRSGGARFTVRLPRPGAP